MSCHFLNIRTLQSGIAMVAVFLGRKNTFDTMDPELLLYILYAYGIHNHLHAWMRSYLHNISQFVLYDNTKSETKHITHGVPKKQKGALVY